MCEVWLTAKDDSQAQADKNCTRQAIKPKASCGSSVQPTPNAAGKKTQAAKNERSLKGKQNAKLSQLPSH